MANFALPDAGFVADGRGRTRLHLPGGSGARGKPPGHRHRRRHRRYRFADTGPISVGAVDAINKINARRSTGAGRRSDVVRDARTRNRSSASRDAVRKVAENAGVPYLDALDPPWLTKDQMRPDLSGPNDEGQSVIADKIAAWLRSEVA